MEWFAAEFDWQVARAWWYDDIIIDKLFPDMLWLTDWLDADDVMLKFYTEYYLNIITAKFYVYFQLYSIKLHDCKLSINHLIIYYEHLCFSLITYSTETVSLVC